MLKILIIRYNIYVNYLPKLNNQITLDNYILAFSLFNLFQSTKITINITIYWMLFEYI